MHNFTTGELLQVFYICMAGNSSGEWCTKTKDWKFKKGGGRTENAKRRSHNVRERLEHAAWDPLASGQRWYCPACGAQYQVKFGPIMEMKISDGAGGYKLVYARVRFPETRGLDLKALCIQFGTDKPLPEGQKTATAEPATAEDLFNSLPRRRPLGEGKSLAAVGLSLIHI